MKIYLCGQKAFGAAVFKMVAEAGHELVGVSAPPGDRLAAAADLAGVPVLPAGMLREETLPHGVDLIMAAHSHDFIGRRTRLKARVGAIGFHPSLLPRHRGRDAIRWAIKMNDLVTGGTVYWLSDTVDGGDIAAQEWCHIPPGTTAGELWRNHLFDIGVRLFAKVLADLSAGVMVAIPQDERLATWEPSWDRQPVRRPDLFMLGDGRSGSSFRVFRERA